MRRNERKGHLKDIRAAIGMTQLGLAKLLGVSKGAIVSIETGRLRLSDAMATKIAIKTGFDPNTGEKRDVDQWIDAAVDKCKAELYYYKSVTP